MSVYNPWTLCPKCVKESKGNVSTLTLRQDYWIGIGSLGDFECNFRALCTTCGFDFTFIKVINVLEPKQ